MRLIQNLQIRILCVESSNFYISDWICTLRIIDDTYPVPGLTVNVFSKTLEELPQIKNHDDMILFTRIKVQESGL